MTVALGTLPTGARQYAGANGTDGGHGGHPELGRAHDHRRRVRDRAERPGPSRSGPYARADREDGRVAQGPAVRERQGAHRPLELGAARVRGHGVRQLSHADERGRGTGVCGPRWTRWVEVAEALWEIESGRLAPTRWTSLKLARAIHDHA